MEQLDALRKLSTFGLHILVNPHLEFLFSNIRDWIEKYVPNNNLTEVEYEKIKSHDTLIYVRSIFSVEKSVITVHFDLETAIQLNLNGVREELANLRLN